ncbi:MAG: ABC transporter permease [Bacteroidota bacterium]
MNLPLFIAKRYFLSKRKKNFINIISIISMTVVAIGTMALIIVLSVFNGFGELLRSLYGTIDANIIVTASYGKSFEYDAETLESIKNLDGVISLTEVVEDNALIKYKDAQRVAKVKGVSDNFITEGRLKNSIAFGKFQLKEGDVNLAIIGYGIKRDLSVDASNDFYPLQLFYPKNITPNMMNPEKMVNTMTILPGGIFAVEKYYDENYIYVPLDFALELFSYQERRTAYEVQIGEEVPVNEMKQKLSQLLGEDYKVLTNEEIHGNLYKILKIEKLFVFLILSIIIAIASINIFFSLTMLAIEKKKDVAILVAQGAPLKLIRNIFLFEGCIVAFTGSFIGLILGLAISFAQQNFGFVSMGIQTAIHDAYPVKVELLDVAYTVLCIVMITVLTSIQPAIKATRKIELHHLQ